MSGEEIQSRSLVNGNARYLLAVVALVVAAVLPQQLGSFGRFIGASILLLAIYGISYDLLYGYAGLTSFGHAAFFGIGAYGVAVALRDVGVGVLGSLGLAFLLSGVMALALGYIAVRVAENAFVIVTILIVLVANLIANTWTGVTGGSDGFTVLVPAIEIGNLVAFPMFNALNQYYLALLAFVLSFLVLHRLVQSPIGLTLKMIRENEQRARMLGYNVRRYKLGVFVVSGMFAGLAGGLNVIVNAYVSAAEFSIVRSADPVIYTIVGGQGTLFGAVFGAILVGFMDFQLSQFTDAYPMIIGAILVLVVLTDPDGLIGMSKRLKDWYTDDED
ncbi:branched-chain amino acid ABC transporter permease [Haloglomus litoreum]|uniref:branched-chain amino acid ABC transporter permease n=1 Tax=Haloglomus litoreum TaxID=3034026 RepID=UPI0023E8DDE5|nr:branched-chain amino acid ABC transporter permease [Haloglomus sp. DT116]